MARGFLGRGLYFRTEFLHVAEPRAPGDAQPAHAVVEAMRIMGGNGFSKDYPVERFYRDAPLLVIGGGTNELQRLIIARGLLQRYAV